MADGEVDILLDGKTVTLRSSLRAARAVNGVAGGFIKAFTRLGEYDIDAYVVIVAAGLGKRPDDVAESVFNTGMKDLLEPLSEYISLLTNGGRSFLSGDGGGDKKGEG